MEELELDMLETLESLLSAGTDSATLRLGIASSYLKKDNFKAAFTHLQIAVKLDPNYSAAWKLLGNTQIKLGLLEDARQTYSNGIKVAKNTGDIQSAKEMIVFLKRIENNTS